MEVLHGPSGPAATRHPSSPRPLKNPVLPLQMSGCYDSSKVRPRPVVAGLSNLLPCKGLESHSRACKARPSDKRRGPKFTAATTSSASAQRAISAGLLSIIPFHSRRASSYPSFPGKRKLPRKPACEPSTHVASGPIRHRPRRRLQGAHVPYLLSPAASPTPRLLGRRFSQLIWGYAPKPTV